MQRELMEKALERHGTIRAAAAALGMPKSTFADRARQWKLAAPGRRRMAGVPRRRYIGATPPLPMATLPPPSPVAPPAAPAPPGHASAPPAASAPPGHASAPMYLSEPDADAWDANHGSKRDADAWDVSAADLMPRRARDAAATEWPANRPPFEWPNVPESAYEAPRDRPRVPSDETSMFELSSSDRVHELFDLSQAPIAAHVLDDEVADEAAFAGANGAATPHEAAFTAANESTTPDEHPPAHMARDSRETF